MNCTRCSGTGFLNLDQVEDEVRQRFDTTGDHNVVLDWIGARNATIERLHCACNISTPCPRCELYHEVQVCDCCGDGTEWYGEPGEHRIRPTGWDHPYPALPDCY